MERKTTSREPPRGEREPGEHDVGGAPDEGETRHLSDFFEDAAVGLHRLDATGRLLWANRAELELLGYEAEQYVGRSLAEFHLDAGAITAVLERVVAGETVRDFEATLRARDGSLRHVLLSSSALFREGAFVHTRGFTQNVTAWREGAEARAAKDARRAEAMYRVGRALSDHLDLDAMVQRVTDAATALCRAQFGAFFYNVTSPAGEHYMLYALSGAPREAFAGFATPRNTAVFAPTFAGERVVRSDDITIDPRYGHNAPHHGMPAGHLPVRSYLAVPVVSRSGEVHGGLFFGHAERAVFTERDARALVAVASQAAVAIDNARLHAATLAAERRYRALAEFSPQLVWATAPDGGLEYCNQRFLDFVGLTLEQYEGDALRDRVVHPDDWAAAAATWRAAQGSGEPYEVEFRLRRASDGAYRWFLARGVSVPDDSGQRARWISTCTDIDDRRRIEQRQRFLSDAGAALAASLDHRATLSSVARLAVPTIADWCVIDVLSDEGALERLAIAHSEDGKVELASTLLTHYPARPDDSVVRVLRQGRSELVPVITDEMLAASVRYGGQLAVLKTLAPRSWMAAPIVAHQRALGVVSFVSSESGRHFDARDLATAEEFASRVALAIDNARLFGMAQRERVRAEDASRAKDLFLGTLSHELRTPLHAILGWAHLLRTDTLPDDKRERALETIDRNARAQVAIIEDILDVSSIVAGKMKLQLAPVELARIVEAALDTVRPAADAKGVQLALLPSDAGALLGDAARLQQIAWNLLSNAVKFTPRGGRVTARVRRLVDHLELGVEDSGQGIEASFLPRVFERFLQADSSATRQHGGLGLGLAIVRHLVELHGGTIRAESEGAGRGAAFTVSLPLAPRRSTPSQPALAPSAWSPEQSGECPPELVDVDILVVDDDPDSRAQLRSVLESCKARVRTAAGASEALEQVRRRPPAILVSDLEAPDEDGYVLIRHLRALPPEQGGRVPAVAVTTSAQPSDRTRALLEGYTEHVSKPAELRELLALLAELARNLPRA